VSLRTRALHLFVEPRADAPAPRGFLPPEPGRPAAPAASAPAAADRAARATPATRAPLRAAVLGPAAESAPLGAVLANALRAAAGAPAAALALWVPGAAPAGAGGPAGLAASRLAARLSARDLPATARGRLAWVALEAHPVAAAVAARRAAGALELPFVTVLAGPRCDVVEGLLADQDLVVIAATDPEGPLARLAVAGCVAAAVACAPPAPGPPRWAARSGFAGTRRLPAPVRSLVRELSAPSAPGAYEAAW